MKLSKKGKYLWLSIFTFFFYVSRKIRSVRKWLIEILFLDDLDEYRCFIEIDLVDMSRIICEKTRNLRVVNGIRERLKLLRQILFMFKSWSLILCVYRNSLIFFHHFFFEFIIYLLLLIKYFLVFIIDIYSNFFSTFLFDFIVLLLKFVDFLDWF